MDDLRIQVGSARMWERAEVTVIRNGKRHGENQEGTRHQIPFVDGARADDGH